MLQFVLLSFAPIAILIDSQSFIFAMMFDWKFWFWESFRLSRRLESIFIDTHTHTPNRNLYIISNCKHLRGDVCVFLFLSIKLSHLKLKKKNKSIPNRNPYRIQWFNEWKWMFVNKEKINIFFNPKTHTQLFFCKKAATVTDFFDTKFEEFPEMKFLPFLVPLIFLFVLLLLLLLRHINEGFLKPYSFETESHQFISTEEWKNISKNRWKKKN